MNQSFSTGWVVDGGNFQAELAGQTTTGNLGSVVPFYVANTAAGNNFWYGFDDGTGTNNLFSDGFKDSFTVQVSAGDVSSVYTLADNTFGAAGANEFNVTFHGANGDIVGQYIGAQNTRDYFTFNCASTGCDATPGATDWYDGGGGAVVQEVQWILPDNFGLTSIQFDQVDDNHGAMVLGVTLGVPEPASWALMITGFGLAGAALRRRRMVAAAA